MCNTQPILRRFDFAWHWARVRQTLFARHKEAKAQVKADENGCQARRTLAQRAERQRLEAAGPIPKTCTLGRSPSMASAAWETGDIFRIELVQAKAESLKKRDGQQTTSDGLTPPARGCEDTTR